MQREPHRCWVARISLIEHAATQTSKVITGIVLLPFMAMFESDRICVAPHHRQAIRYTGFFIACAVFTCCFALFLQTLDVPILPEVRKTVKRERLLR